MIKHLIYIYFLMAVLAIPSGVSQFASLHDIQCSVREEGGINQFLCEEKAQRDNFRQDGFGGVLSVDAAGNAQTEINVSIEKYGGGAGGARISGQDLEVVNGAGVITHRNFSPVNMRPMVSRAPSVVVTGELGETPLNINLKPSVPGVASGDAVFIGNAEEINIDVSGRNGQNGRDQMSGAAMQILKGELGSSSDPQISELVNKMGIEQCGGASCGVTANPEIQVEDLMKTAGTCQSIADEQKIPNMRGFEEISADGVTGTAVTKKAREMIVERQICDRKTSEEFAIQTICARPPEIRNELYCRYPSIQRKVDKWKRPTEQKKIAFSCSDSVPDGHWETKCASTKYAATAAMVRPRYISLMPSTSIQKAMIRDFYGHADLGGIVGEDYSPSDDVCGETMSAVRRLDRGGECKDSESEELAANQSPDAYGNFYNNLLHSKWFQEESYGQKDNNEAETGNKMSVLARTGSIVYPYTIDSFPGEPKDTADSRSTLTKLDYWSSISQEAGKHETDSSKSTSRMRANWFNVKERLKDGSDNYKSNLEDLGFEGDLTYKNALIAYNKITVKRTENLQENTTAWPKICSLPQYSHMPQGEGDEDPCITNGGKRYQGNDIGSILKYHRLLVGDDDGSGGSPPVGIFSQHAVDTLKFREKITYKFDKMQIGIALKPKNADSPVIRALSDDITDANFRKKAIYIPGDLRIEPISVTEYCKEIVITKDDDTVYMESSTADGKTTFLGPEPVGGTDLAIYGGNGLFDEWNGSEYDWHVSHNPQNSQATTHWSDRLFGLQGWASFRGIPDGAAHKRKIILPPTSRVSAWGISTLINRHINPVCSGTTTVHHTVSRKEHQVLSRLRNANGLLIVAEASESGKDSHFIISVYMSPARIPRNTGGYHYSKGLKPGTYLPVVNVAPATLTADTKSLFGSDKFNIDGYGAPKEAELGSFESQEENIMDFWAVGANKKDYESEVYPNSRDATLQSDFANSADYFAAPKDWFDPKGTRTLRESAVPASASQFNSENWRTRGTLNNGTITKFIKTLKKFVLAGQDSNSTGEIKCDGVSADCSHGLTTNNNNKEENQATRKDIILTDTLVEFQDGEPKQRCRPDSSIFYPSKLITRSVMPHQSNFSDYGDESTQEFDMNISHDPEVSDIDSVRYQMDQLKKRQWGYLTPAFLPRSMIRLGLQLDEPYHLAQDINHLRAQIALNSEINRKKSKNQRTNRFTAMRNALKVAVEDGTASRNAKITSWLRKSKYSMNLKLGDETSLTQKKFGYTQQKFGYIGTWAPAMPEFLDTKDAALDGDSLNETSFRKGEGNVLHDRDLLVGDFKPGYIRRDPKRGFYPPYMLLDSLSADSTEILIKKPEADWNWEEFMRRRCGNAFTECTDQTDSEFVKNSKDIYGTVTGSTTYYRHSMCSAEACGILDPYCPADQVKPPPVDLCYDKVSVKIFSSTGCGAGRGGGFEFPITLGVRPYVAYPSMSGHQTSTPGCDNFLGNDRRDGNFRMFASNKHDLESGQWYKMTKDGGYDGAWKAYPNHNFYAGYFLPFLRASDAIYSGSKGASGSSAVNSHIGVGSEGTTFFDNPVCKDNKCVEDFDEYLLEFDNDAILDNRNYPGAMFLPAIGISIDSADIEFSRFVSSNNHPGRGKKTGNCNGTKGYNPNEGTWRLVDEGCHAFKVAFHQFTAGNSLDMFGTHKNRTNGTDEKLKYTNDYTNKDIGAHRHEKIEKQSLSGRLGGCATVGDSQSVKYHDRRIGYGGTGLESNPKGFALSPQGGAYYGKLVPIDPCQDLTNESACSANALCEVSHKPQEEVICGHVLDEDKKLIPNGKGGYKTNDPNCSSDDAAGGEIYYPAKKFEACLTKQVVLGTPDQSFAIGTTPESDKEYDEDMKYNFFRKLYVDDTTEGEGEGEGEIEEPTANHRSFAEGSTPNQILSLQDLNDGKRSCFKTDPDTSIAIGDCTSDNSEVVIDFNTKKGRVVSVGRLVQESSMDFTATDTDADYIYEYESNIALMPELLAAFFLHGDFKEDETTGHVSVESSETSPDKSGILFQELLGGDLYLDIGMNQRLKEGGLTIGKANRTKGPLDDAGQDYDTKEYYNGMIFRGNEVVGHPVIQTSWLWTQSSLHVEVISPKVEDSVAFSDLGDDRDFSTGYRNIVGKRGLVGLALGKTCEGSVNCTLYDIFGDSDDVYTYDYSAGNENKSGSTTRGSLVFDPNITTLASGEAKPFGLQRVFGTDGLLGMADPDPDSYWEGQGPGYYFLNNFCKGTKNIEKGLWEPNARYSNSRIKYSKVNVSEQVCKSLSESACNAAVGCTFKVDQCLAVNYSAELTPFEYMCYQGAMMPEPAEVNGACASGDTSCIAVFAQENLTTSDSNSVVPGVGFGSYSSFTKPNNAIDYTHAVPLQEGYSAFQTTDDQTVPYAAKNLYTQLVKRHDVKEHGVAKECSIYDNKDLCLDNLCTWNTTFGCVSPHRDDGNTDPRDPPTCEELDELYPEFMSQIFVVSGSVEENMFSAKNNWKDASGKEALWDDVKGWICPCDSSVANGDCSASNNMTEVSRIYTNLFEDDKQCYNEETGMSILDRRTSKATENCPTFDSDTKICSLPAYNNVTDCEDNGGWWVSPTQYSFYATYIEKNKGEYRVEGDIDVTPGNPPGESGRYRYYGYTIVDSKEVKDIYPEGGDGKINDIGQYVDSDESWHADDDAYTVPVCPVIHFSPINGTYSEEKTHPYLIADWQFRTIKKRYGNLDTHYLPTEYRQVRIPDMDSTTESQSIAAAAYLCGPHNGAKYLSPPSYCDNSDYNNKPECDNAGANWITQPPEPRRYPQYAPLGNSDASSSYDTCTDSRHENKEDCESEGGTWGKPHESTFTYAVKHNYVSGSNSGLADRQYTPWSSEKISGDKLAAPTCSIFNDEDNLSDQAEVVLTREKLDACSTKQQSACEESSFCTWDSSQCVPQLKIGPKGFENSFSVNPDTWTDSSLYGTATKSFYVGGSWESSGIERQTISAQEPGDVSCTFFFDSSKGTDSCDESIPITYEQVNGYSLSVHAESGEHGGHAGGVIVLTTHEPSIISINAEGGRPGLTRVPSFDPGQSNKNLFCIKESQDYENPWLTLVKYNSSLISVAPGSNGQPGRGGEHKQHVGWGVMPDAIKWLQSRLQSPEE